MSFDSHCPELNGRSVNGICTLVHQANFSEGGFAKLVPFFPTFIIIIFYRFFGDLVRGTFGDTFFFIQLVCLGKGKGNAW